MNIIYIYMYVLVYVYVYVYACVYAYVYVYVDVCATVDVYVCVDVYACMNVCMYAALHVCMYVFVYVCVYMYVYIYIYAHIYIYMHIWGLSKIMVPENALTLRFREPFAPFRAPAESGHEIIYMIRFSFTYRFISIMVFRPFANLTPPFRGLSPLQQNTLGY